MQVSEKDITSEPTGARPPQTVTESETSESDIYGSSDNQQSKDRIREGASRLEAKGQELREKRLNAASSADDKPKKSIPPAAAPKKSGLMIRVVSSTFLLSFQCLSYACGHLYYALFLLYCGFKCYFELIQLKRNERKEKKIVLQHVLDWFYPIALVFTLAPRTLLRRILVDNDSLWDFKNDTPQLYRILFVHHSFISAMLLIIVLVLFTLTLEKGQYRYQFRRLGWQILCSLLPISGSLFFGYYVFKGYFWVILTNGSVMVNDIMAFVFGKTMGKTKLIQLSPNKTVEGFVGCGITTVLFAIWISGYISQFQQITCPQVELNLAPFKQLTCERPDIYEPQNMSLPLGLGNMTMSPAQIHAAVIALFAALIAPFGGFFASGLKRGLRIKDFSDSIPGHGGFADRFDCHIVISFFVYIYLTQWVYKGGYGIERVFDYIQKLDDDSKIQIYKKLHQMYGNSTGI